MKKTLTPPKKYGKKKYEFQVNLHFGKNHVSAFCGLAGVVGRGVGDCLRRIVNRYGLKTEEIMFTFQPE